MEKSQLLFDTDILIDYLRGKKEAVEFIENLAESNFLASAITVAELFAGIRNEKEKNQLEMFLMGFEIIPIEKVTAEIGGTFRKKFSKSHGTGLGDAIIAASPEIRKLPIVTFNKRHFPMSFEVIVPYAKI